MPKIPEKPVRVSEMTHHRIGYLAGSLAINQGAVVELVVDKAMSDAKEELDNLARIMLNGNASHAEIIEARAALLAKFKPVANHVELREVTIGEIPKGPYGLSEITTRGHFLVREHMMDYREEHAPEYSKEDVGRALSMLVNPEMGWHKSPRTRQKLDPKEQFGLIVKSRKELGFRSSGPNIYIKDGINVGSFLDFVDSIGINGFSSLYGHTENREGFLVDLAQHLQQQIEAK